MDSLIIYDATGHILSIMQGHVYEPIGVPILRTEVPTGKRVTEVDISVTPHVPIFEDLPKSQEIERIELLEDSQLNAELETDYRLCMLELGLV